MKRLIAAFLMIVLCLPFAACQSGNDPDGQPEDTAPSDDVVYFKTAEAAILPGETLQLEYNTPNGKTVEFSSSDASVMTVNESGVITGIAPGTATIIASTGEYEKAYLGVTVKRDVTPSQFNAALKSDKVELVVGSDYDLTLSVQKDGAALVDYTVEWASSDQSVAAVKDGVVTAAAPGTAVVSASVKVGDDTAEKDCLVIVYDHYDIKIEEDRIDACIGKEFSVSYSVRDSAGNAVTPAAGEVEYITSNPLAIDVRADGFRVIGTGTASVGVRYKGNVASIPVDIFSVTADFFSAYSSDFYGEIEGETISGVRINCTVYQPYFYFTEEGMKTIREYAAERGYTTLVITFFAKNFNNSFRINGSYNNINKWQTAEVPVSDLVDGFYFWSESEGITDIYMWFTFR